MANVENDYNFRRAVLQRLAAANAGAASGDVSDIAQEHAAAAGRTAAEAESLASDVALGERRLALGEKQLAEGEREFQTKLSTDRQILDAWGDQNRWATAIAVANLGVQALSIPAAIRTADKQDALLKGIADERGKQVSATIAGNKTIAEQMGEFETSQSLRKVYGAEEPAIEGYRAPVVVETNPLANAARARRMPGSGLPALYQH
jgi:hypothetical protein